MPTGQNIYVPENATTVLCAPAADIGIVGGFMVV